MDIADNIAMYNMRLALVVAVATAVCAERDNLCFTAHAKTSLQCTKMLLDGPIDVYDDTQSPQKARKLFYSGGKLCDSKRCSKCMDRGAGIRYFQMASCQPVRLA